MRREQMKQVRADFERARRYGLEQRHRPEAARIRAKEEESVGRKNPVSARGTRRWYGPQSPMGPPPIPDSCRACEPGYRCPVHWSGLTDAERRAVLRERSTRSAS